MLCDGIGAGRAGKGWPALEMYRKTMEWAEAGRRFALATVIRSEGSTSQKPGAKALLDEAGVQLGTLGGGIVEAEGLRRMKQALEDGGTQRFEFRLDSAYSRDAGSICGGHMVIFVEPGPQRNLEGYRAAFKALESSTRGVLVTITAGNADDVGRVQWIEESAIDSAGPFPQAEDLRHCLSQERTACVVAEDGTEAFVEPVLGLPRLLIVGGGHIGQALAALAVQLGFDITVLDDREEFANAALFPGGVKAVCGDIAEKVAEFPMDRHTHIVLVSRGHKTDADALEACIHSDAAYIGMIGSRRKVQLIRKDFIESGQATEAEFDRVATPIGFDIGAITVPEIAISIAAQLVAAKRSPGGGRLAKT